MKILIIGGYGTFGGRLAQLLATDERLTLLIAGRSEKKATHFCDQLPLGAKKSALYFDRDGDVHNQIKILKPDVIVDATGPFQFYGEDPYRIVKACIANAIDYMDLADGSAFVKGIHQFDAEAKAKNIYILSGVSSFPVLTAAVVRRLSKGFSRINTITGGIAPSPYAGVGLNVIRAIASYAGKKLSLVRDGKKTYGYAFIETMRYTIGVPGYMPLNNILFSLVDVPDLQVLPDLWPEAESIWMGAGPVPEILHRMLNGLAWLGRLRLLPSLSPFASLFYFVTNLMRWGEHRGGMFVSVTGIDSKGEKIERSWHLLAEGNDGPFIPSMAVEAIVRRSLENNQPVSGARAATRDLELEDYEALFQNKTIYTGQRESQANIHMPLYQRILGDAWKLLPVQIKAIHACNGELKAEGLANVERGTGLLSRLIAILFGFPKAGEDIPVQVFFRVKENGELWQRTFFGKSFSSFQTEGQGRADKLLCEQFGPFTFGLALMIKDEKLYLVVRRWSFFGLPLPKAFAPNGSSYEFVEHDCFHFNVEIKYKWIGLVVRYRGWLIIMP